MDRDKLTEMKLNAFQRVLAFTDQLSQKMVASAYVSYYNAFSSLYTLAPRMASTRQQVAYLRLM